jgi:hypothetical protein
MGATGDEDRVEAVYRSVHPRRWRSLLSYTVTPSWRATPSARPEQRRQPTELATTGIACDCRPG